LNSNSRGSSSQAIGQGSCNGEPVSRGPLAGSELENSIRPAAGTRGSRVDRRDCGAALRRGPHLMRGIEPEGEHRRPGVEDDLRGLRIRV
jgi:hypothetical protein